MPVSLLLSAVVVICLSFLLILLLSFRRSRVLDQKSTINFDELSIIIPFKDEPSLSEQFNHLNHHLNSVNTQVYWIDDFSSNQDLSFESEISNHPNFHLVKRDEGIPGKKMAIVDALKLVKSDWVMLMDADTFPIFNSIKENDIVIESYWKMVLIPLRPSPFKSIIRRLFDLEFTVLQLATHLSINLGKPLLANGAALLVNREAYLKTVSDRKDLAIPSGDDVFAMFALSNLFGRKSIGTLYSQIDPFDVKFPIGGKQLFRQRLRWVSKSPKVSDTWFQLVSFLVLLGNLSFVFLLLSFPISKAVATVLVSYLLASVIFIWFALEDFKRRDVWSLIIPAIFIFPFYLVVLVLASIFSHPKWN